MYKILIVSILIFMIVIIFFLIFMSFMNNDIKTSIENFFDIDPVITNGNIKGNYVEFLGNGSIEFKEPTNCEWFIVGGGGGGGSRHGGGGGGGSVIYRVETPLPAGKYDIIIGQGGSSIVYGQ